MKKIINASSNLKKNLDLRTKIKSNGYLQSRPKVGASRPMAQGLQILGPKIYFLLIKPS